jgi:hypothetical protein
MLDRLRITTTMRDDLVIEERMEDFRMIGPDV